MTRLPSVITTSVVRSVQQGESHGGLYIVDLETSEISQILDWNNSNIRWEGRGLDRGLRGIAFYEDLIYVAASDEIFIYDRSFAPQGSIRNPFLQHCHEISIQGATLLLTSTGYDSVLVYDLVRQEFTHGFSLRIPPMELGLAITAFDPNAKGKGPVSGDTIHINNVIDVNGKIAVCGTYLRNIYYISDGRLERGEPVPRGTHNAQPYMNGTLVNDTQSDHISWFDTSGNLLKSVPVIQYPEHQLSMTNIPTDHARQGFARGLCIGPEGLIIGGSSPSTISVYDLPAQKLIKSVALTSDIRNSIHGLEIWPY